MIFKKIKWLSLIIGLSISINSFAADSEILNFPNKIDYLINLVGKKDSFKDGIIFKKYIKENIEVSGDFSYIYNTDSSVKNDDYIIHIVNVKNDALKEDNKEKFKDNLKKYFNKESKE